MHGSLVSLPKFSQAANPSGMEELWASVAGRRMRYLAGGSGRPLLLVHGIAASSFSYRLNWAELVRCFRVFIPDIMSVGYSNRTSGLDCSLRGNALRLREFLDEVGIERTDIVGSSYGGAVVMELANLAPERLAHMILVAPANPFASRYHRVLRFYLSGLGGIFVRLAPFMPAQAWDYGIGRMYANPKCMVVGTGLGYARALRARGVIRHIRSCLKTFAQDVEELRSKLRAMANIPTLIIWGDRDPVVELPSGYKLQQELEAELVVMPGVGHLPYEESPEEFNRIVKNFVLGNFVIL